MAKDVKIDDKEEIEFMNKINQKIAQIFEDLKKQE